MRRTFLALLLALAAPATASPDEAVIDEAAREMSARAQAEAESAALTAEAVKAFRAGEYGEAERILLEQKELDPQNFVVHYNLACARAVLGRLDEANADLRRAVELGFANQHHLLVDPYLAPLRETEPFRLLVEHWPGVLEQQRKSRLAHARSWVRTIEVERKDAPLRIDVVSAHDQTLTEQAMVEIRRVAAWAGDGLMPGVGGREDAPYVVVALPDQQDFLKWAFWTYGQRARRAFAGIGGAYEHDQKRLVAQDLGSTLRHEFFHVLHWRDMDRLGQIHPVWIQEGLASLVEDMDPARIVERRRGAAPADPGRWRGVDPNLIPAADRGTDDEAAGGGASVEDAFVPAASWRTNIVKRLARTGGIPSLTELAEMDHQTFSTQRPLATYANARTVFLYLYDMGLLERWYRTYTTDAEHGFEADPRGLAAMEAVFGEELEQIEERYLDWVRHVLPEVAETGTDLTAVLGVDIEQGEGDGPVVTRLPPGSRSRTGLRRMDVITAIDGRPTRDMKELVRVLADYRSGEIVTVSYRRVKLHGQTEAELIERQ